MADQTDNFMTALFGAQRDLIHAAGGIERVAFLTSYSKSQAGRWNEKQSPVVMPIPAVRVLERDTGAAFVTAVMAGVTGRKLTDPDEMQAKALSIVQCMMRERVTENDLQLAVLEAIADGYVTPTEGHICLAKFGAKEASLHELKRALIAAICNGGSGATEGGEAASLRVVKDGTP